MKNWTKALINVGVTLVCFVLAAFSRLIILPVIALAAYMGVYWGIWYLIPPVIALVGGNTLFSGVDPGSLCCSAMLVLLPVILVIYGRKKLPHRYALLALAITLCLGLYLSAAIVPMLNGEPPYAMLAEAWDSAVISSFTSVFSDGLAGYAETLEFLNSFTELLPNFMMAAVLLMAEFSAMALLFSFRLWQKVFRTAPARMAKFCYWRLPQSSLIGAAVLIALIAVVYVLKVQQATAIALTLGLIILSMFSVQGLAYIMFVLRIARAPKLMRVLIWVMSALLYPSSMIFLSITGIAEQIQNKRRKVIEYLRQESERSRLERRAEEYAKYGYIREEKEEKGAKDEKKEDE